MLARIALGVLPLWSWKDHRDGGLEENGSGTSVIKGR